MALDYKKKSEYWDQKRRAATTPRRRNERRRVEVSTSVSKEMLSEEGASADLRAKSKHGDAGKKPDRERIHIKRRSTRPKVARRREDFEVVPDAPLVEYEVDPIRAQERRKVAQKRTERQKRVARTNMRTVVTILVVGVLAAVALGALVAFLRSPFFLISEYVVKGNEFLSSSNILSSVPTDERTSILPLSTTEVEEALLVNPWIRAATVTKRLPSTLEITIDERKPVAIVTMVNEESWVISDDGVWLGRLGDESGTKTAYDPHGEHATIPLDKGSLVSIVDITPMENVFGTPTQSPEVLNAIEILQGLEAALYAQVELISAPEIPLTRIITTDHVEILFGNSRDAREKSKIALALLREHEDKVTLINVRSVDKPTWRGLDTEPE